MRASDLPFFNFLCKQRKRTANFFTKEQQMEEVNKDTIQTCEKMLSKP